MVATTSSTKLISVKRRDEEPIAFAHDFIARMNRDYLGATLRTAFQPESASAGGGA